MHRIKSMLLLMLFISIIGLPRAGAESTPTASYSIDGNYQVTVRPEHYHDYSTMVTITKIDDSTIKINGTYDGIPLTARGVLRKQNSSSGTDTYDVKVNNGLF
ncbi:MAG: PEGA domain-containing protein, partial [Methylocystaceae bacterium]